MAYFRINACQVCGAFANNSAYGLCRACILRADRGDVVFDRIAGWRRIADTPSVAPAALPPLSTTRSQKRTQPPHADDNLPAERATDNGQ